MASAIARADGSGKIAGGRNAPARSGSHGIAPHRTATRSGTRGNCAAARGSGSGSRARRATRDANMPRRCNRARPPKRKPRKLRTAGQLAAGFPGAAGASGRAARRIGNHVRAACQRRSAAEQRLTEELAQARRAHGFAAAAARGPGPGKRRSWKVPASSSRMQVEELRKEKMRLEEQKAALEKEWEESRDARRRNSTRRCAATANRSTNCARSAASGKSKKRATTRTAIICARPAWRN